MATQLAAPSPSSTPPVVEVDDQRLATLPEKRITAMTIRAVLKRGLGFWRPYWKTGVVVLALMTVQELFSTFFDLSIGRITDQVLIARNGALLAEILGQLAVAYLIAAGATILGDYLVARVGAHILNDLRAKLFTHMQRLSMNYYDRAHTGDIVARFTSDLAEIDKGLTVRFTDGNLALIGLLINVPTLFILQWRLALIVVLATPLVTIGPALLAPRASRAFFRLKREQGALASGVQENAQAQEIVKVFGLQRTMLGRLGNQLGDLFKRTVKATFLSSLVGTTSSLGVRLASLLVIGVGAVLAFNGVMTIGTLVAFILLLIDVTGDAYSLSKKVMPSVIAAGGGIQRMDEMLAEPVEVTDAPDAATLPRLAESIRFEDVSFSYDHEHPVLHDISVEIPAGRYVAFVGPTGAGKTTILSLLARFYDPTAGGVLVDGRNVRGVTQDSLHGQMAAVLQETFLFNTTIRENIRLSKLDATNEEIEAAAKAAEVHEAILALPLGYETPAGEMGGMLSGGQRQRISIARAILRNPAILLVDEPTNDLDARTEAAITATLERLAQHRTVVAVTHRLTTIQRADRIYVLDAGHVIEEGTHADLLRQDGLYTHLWQKQHGGEHVA